MYRTHFIAALALLALATGCSSAPADSSSEASSIEQALGEDFGAMTPQAEQPMFGESATYAHLDEAADDVIDRAPSTDIAGTQIDQTTDAAILQARDPAMTEAERPLVYGIAVTWGRLLVDPDAKSTVAWNPTVSTDCGAIAVRRLVRMEPGEGTVRPRTGAQTVSFTSSTTPSFDGVILVLAIPANEKACTATGKLRFTSAALPAALEVPLDDSLADLVLRAPGPSGTSVVALGHKLEPKAADGCERGNISGRWVMINDPSEAGRQVGKFYGRVTDELGDPRGYIRGIYGMPVKGHFAGEHVFFGKYIDQQGGPAGLLAGKYREVDIAAPPEAPTPDGVFGGGWHLKPLADPSALQGLVGGVYKASDEANTEGGGFRGRYASKQCLAQLKESSLYQSAAK